MQTGPRHKAAHGPAALLFVHGVCHGAWCWERWSGWFADRGRDGTAMELQDASAGLDAHCREVLAAAEQLDRPVLVAHSLGGAAAQLAVAERPDLFRAMVLVAAPPPDGLRLGEMLAPLRDPRGLMMLRRLNRGRRLTPAEVLALPFLDGRISLREAALASERLRPAAGPAGREAVRLCTPPATVPVLVLGSRRDRLLPLRALQRTARHHGGALAVLEEACHDLMLDPDWALGAAAIADWLAERGL